MSGILLELRKVAEEACERAYSPFSRFPVGAAVLTSSGEIFSGCNIENASFGLAICAERVAIFKAVEAGQRLIEQLAVYTPTDRLVSPCGACRQVLAEFGPSATVWAYCLDERFTSWSLSELLPDRFSLE